MSLDETLARVALGTLLAVGFGGVARWRRANRGEPDRWITALSALGCLGPGAAWISRWIAAGHLPVFGTYESALSLAFFVAVGAAWAEGRDGRRGALLPFASFVGAAIIAHGLSYDPTVYALTISERSWIVDAHALIAWAAFGVLTLNGAAAWSALRSKGEPPRRTGLDLGATLHLGFFLHTAMLASGSLYGFLLFGRAWDFDPIETLGITAWLAYGALLHIHLFAGWSDRRLARWCLGVFVLLVVSYRAIVYFPAISAYHIFDVDLRLHIRP